MKKSDLKSGMMLVLRDDGECLLIGTEMFLVRGGSISLHFFDDDLNMIGRKGDSEYSIVEVKEPILPSSSNIGIDLMRFLKDSDRFFKSIWVRPPDVEEMTIREICEALGKEIKLVKEK